MMYVKMHGLLKHDDDSNRWFISADADLMKQYSATSVVRHPETSRVRDAFMSKYRGIITDAIKTHNASRTLN